jgi:hypothetical protein
VKKNRQFSTESTAVLAQQQTAVITALIGGATVTDATKAASVDRTTFYLWLKTDASFQAELNRAKREQMEAMRAQLRALADIAVATVQQMLTGPDVPAGVRLKAALAVLRSVGTLEPEPIGNVDPDKIASDMFVEQIATFPSAFPVGG